MDAGSGSSSVVGKVAAVVDGTTLVLNVGGEQGVTEGMVFAIAAQYQEISDPDTDESLGNWEVEKARVVVSHVQERMCTVRSPLTPAVAPIGTLSTMMVRHSFGLYGARERDRQRLEVGGSSVTGRPRTQPIEVGDTIRSVSFEGLSTEVRTAGATEAASDLPSQSYTASSPPLEEEDA